MPAEPGAGAGHVSDSGVPAAESGTGSGSGPSPRAGEVGLVRGPGRDSSAPVTPARLGVEQVATATVAGARITPAFVMPAGTDVGPVPGLSTPAAPDLASAAPGAPGVAQAGTTKSQPVAEEVVKTQTARGMVLGTPTATTSGADPLSAVPVPPLGPAAPPADPGHPAAWQGSVATGRAPGAGGIDPTVPSPVGDVPAISTPGTPHAPESGPVSTGLPAQLPPADANLAPSTAAQFPPARTAAARATPTPVVPDNPAPGTPGTPATTATPATVAMPGAATADSAATAAPAPASAATPAPGTVAPAMVTQPRSPQAPSGEILDGPVAVRQIAPEQGSAAATAGSLAPAAFSAGPAFTGATQWATNATAPVAPSGAPAQFSLPAPVHQQVFTAVSPLLRADDGSYGVRLQLHPRELGAVQVIVDVRHGEISIQMHSADAAARDALRGGLSDLRQQLEGQGLSAGSMEVGSGGAHARQTDTPWSRPGTPEGRSRGGQPPDRNVAAPAAASSTSLDLRM